MKLCSALLLCLAAASLSAAFVVSSPKMWTRLILTHHWPKTFCHMEHCHPNISYWTLHGLWPDNGMNCNSSWPLDLPEIEDLLPDMRKSWPDLINPSSPQFWKYEWHKHGTCAAKAESLNSQHKYFSKALELYHKVDLNSILGKFDITPSDKYYSFSQIEEAIENFYGVKTKIQCTHTKGDDYQSLGQIEICFSPDFTLVDCERHHGAMSKGGWDRPKSSGLMVCSHDTPVFYPPHV